MCIRDSYPYSIDEVFIDATSYLQTYHLSAREFARKIILDILQTTGITAAAVSYTQLQGIQREVYPYCF